MTLDNKFILDSCCGSRMMWFNKQHPNALYVDIRKESHVLCDGRSLEVNPDVVADFRSLPFPDETFHLVVFDPPHLNKIGEGAWMAKKYGKLLPTWQDDLRQGYEECMRVLQPFGILIFKWNEHQVKLSQVLSALQAQPLFGHTSGRHGKTIWMAFMKLPNLNQQP